MRFFQKIKNWKTVRGWHIWKLKLVDARLYFVSMIVGLLTGLIAVTLMILTVLCGIILKKTGAAARKKVLYVHRSLVVMVILVVIVHLIQMG